MSASRTSDRAGENVSFGIQRENSCRQVGLGKEIFSLTVNAFCTSVIAEGNSSNNTTSGAKIQELLSLYLQL